MPRVLHGMHTFMAEQQGKVFGVVMPAQDNFFIRRIAKPARAAVARAAVIKNNLVSFRCHLFQHIAAGRALGQNKNGLFQYLMIAVCLAVDFALAFALLLFGCKRIGALVNNRPDEIHINGRAGITLARYIFRPVTPLCRRFGWRCRRWIKKEWLSSLLAQT